MAPPQGTEPTTGDRVLLAATSFVALALLIALIVQLTQGAY